MQEYGTIECVAKNPIGLQMKACKYHILAAGPPNFPYMCNVVNQSDNALVILCTGNDQSAMMAANWTSNELRFEQSSNTNYLSSGPNAKTVVVYPPTYYVCEVYNNNNLYLVANVSVSATVPLGELSTNSLLSDATNSFLDNSINSMTSSVPSSASANSFQMFVPNLTPNTNFKLKLFAANSKGKSDQIWLSAHTLRPAERLVDSNTNGSHDGTPPFLRGKPMILALLAGAAVVTLIVMALGIIAVVRVRASTNNSPPVPPDNRQSPNPAAATLFEEEEDQCDQCCDDDCCDEMLLTSTAPPGQQTGGPQQVGQQLCQNANSKGPPDIIPSFGYLSGGLDNKNFISYAYQTEDSVQYVPQSDSGLHYAELSFCGQTMPQTIGGHPSLAVMSKPVVGQQSVEYAKIEFNKSQTPTQRVNLIGGSPKFESTV